MAYAGKPTANEDAGQFLLPCKRHEISSVTKNGNEPGGAFLLQSFFAVSSEARSYEVKGTLRTCNIRRIYSAGRLNTRTVIIYLDYLVVASGLLEMQLL